MSKVYGGLVSSPYNRIDTDSRGSVTYTYNGTVINGSAGDAVEVDGGDTPESTEPTPAVQVFTDAECTTRPVEGSVYETLYVRLNRAYGFGDSAFYAPGTGSLDSLDVITPDSEEPDISYHVYLWVDWQSEDFDSPFQAGSVIPVSLVDAPSLPSSFTVDFYDE